MTNYRCGDIVLAKVIFSEGEGVKRRPALVVSSDIYNEIRQKGMGRVIRGFLFFKVKILKEILLSK
jgi:mRNA-degrading endonuclease toxin of MazEF toxin-antitoxin module